MCLSADPASVARRQEALEVSRQRMQEELNARAEEFKEKQKRVSCRNVISGHAFEIL